MFRCKAILSQQYSARLFEKKLKYKTFFFQLPLSKFENLIYWSQKLSGTDNFALDFIIGSFPKTGVLNFGNF